ncbi:hypothetical protein P280DRAFT_437900 [Massarina eburnea CBS 473.64]|uniref:Uncharacterized protein n=1 Tax=Massarina eburnea CBS 473.64 TaxID=1395130 RepID=A0A6A6RIF1_9PLEO|nr:hypothetical protein P280DRAFT_437900 [Massarina eburnea CBS 473.64]
MAKQIQPPTLRLAEILSDLVSLRICDPTAALALVSARLDSSSKPSDAAVPVDEQDADLKRAKDLVELHYAVKEANRRGELGRGLAEARRAVESAVWG